MDDGMLKDLERATLAEAGQRDWRIDLRRLAKNTASTYRTRLRFFDAYMAKRWPGVPPEAPEDKMLAYFLIVEYRRGLGASGLKQSVNAVNWRAGVLGHDKPAGVRTKTNLAALRKACRGKGRGSAPSLSEKQVHKLIADTVKAGDIWSSRDAALFTVLYYGLLRISECLDLDVEDLTFFSDGRCKLFLPKRKNDQQGLGTKITLPKPGADLLAAWLDFSGIESGPVFRGIRAARYGKPTIASSRLTPVHSRRIMQERAKDAGVGHITGHTFRRSHARALKEKGASLVEVQHAGGWGSPSMPSLYAGFDESHGAVMEKFYPTERKLRAVKSA